MRERAEEKENASEDGLVIIQGGGNDRENVETDETVNEMVEAVNSMAGKNDVSLAVIGVMLRTRESTRCERVRCKTNKMLHVQC